MRFTGIMKLQKKAFLRKKLRLAGPLKNNQSENISLSLDLYGKFVLSGQNSLLLVQAHSVPHISLKAGRSRRQS